MSKWSAQHGGQLDDEGMHENNIMNGDKFCILNYENFEFQIVLRDENRWQKMV